MHGSLSAPRSVAPHRIASLHLFSPVPSLNRGVSRTFSPMVSPRRWNAASTRGSILLLASVLPYFPPILMTNDAMRLRKHVPPLVAKKPLADNNILQKLHPFDDSVALRDPSDMESGCCTPAHLAAETASAAKECVKIKKSKDVTVDKDDAWRLFDPITARCASHPLSERVECIAIPLLGCFVLGCTILGPP